MPLTKGSLSVKLMGAGNFTDSGSALRGCSKTNKIKVDSDQRVFEVSTARLSKCDDKNTRTCWEGMPNKPVTLFDALTDPDPLFPFTKEDNKLFEQVGLKPKKYNNA